jgi:hypothetical protein
MRAYHAQGSPLVLAAAATVMAAVTLGLMVVLPATLQPERAPGPVLAIARESADPVAAPGCREAGLLLGEADLAATGVDLHRIAGAEPAGEDVLRQGVLDLLLDRAL